jgi:tRNA (guanine-N7-)-methyltransferase
MRGLSGYRGAAVPRPNHPYAHAAVLPEGEELDPRALLAAGTSGSDAPVELEIGPGRGGFITERLEALPEARIIGLEVRLKWASIVDTRLAAKGLGGRGRVFAEDARRALPRFKSGTVSAVFIHFPDPWWKKRHQKRLVASSDLLSEVVRLLVPSGELYLQTDVLERAEGFEALVAEVPELTPHGDEVGSARLADNPYQARSPRERRAMADGLPVVRLRYQRARGAAR